MTGHTVLMTLRGAVLAACTLLQAAVLGAQTTQSARPSVPAPADTPTHFKPMEFLVGSCWIGTFPDGRRTDEHCFEWVYDRKFIRDRHIVRGGAPYEGETLYGKQGSDALVSYWYWSSTGGISTGQMDAVGDALIFPERHVSATGVLEMRAVWRRTAADRYRVVQEQRRGTEWTTAWTMDMVRQPARHPSPPDDLTPAERANRHQGPLRDDHANP